MRDSDMMLLAAKDLCRQAGLTEPVSLQPLSGGRNNRVFRLDFASGPPLLLKSYSRDPRDKRNRLQAEWALLEHAWASGITSTARPLAKNETERLTLMTYLSGAKLEPAAIAADHVRQGADFICALNAPCKAERFAPASEACFSIEDHMRTIDRRVERLQHLDPEAPSLAEAETFILSCLHPSWQQIREKIEQAKSSFSENEKIVSPSDFGFHNMLVDKGHLFFFDFEYAGSDDPAKLTCDFFCCPEIPVSFRFFEDFTDHLRNNLSLDDSFPERCRLLLDAYRVKWACIILNDFLPMDEARRSFALTESREERCAQQLEKARRKLAEINNCHSRA